MDVGVRVRVGMIVAVAVVVMVVVVAMGMIVVMAMFVSMVMVVIVVVSIDGDGFGFADGEPERDGVDDDHGEQGRAAEEDPDMELGGQHVLEAAAVPEDQRHHGEGAACPDGEELLHVEFAGVVVMVVVNHETISERGGNRLGPGGNHGGHGLQSAAVVFPDQMDGVRV